MAAAALVLGCGNGVESGSGADAVVADTPAPAAPVTLEQVHEAERRQLVEDSTSFETRRSSMSSYADCVNQARGLDSAPRATILAACRNLPDAPGR